jgi:hypothetical protein
MARLPTMRSEMHDPNKTEMNATSAERRILEQIEHLRRDWHARRSTPQPASSCIVRAYHELLDRHYETLDGLAGQPIKRSINIP